jgi:hypothetical protein
MSHASAFRSALLFVLRTSGSEHEGTAHQARGHDLPRPTVRIHREVAGITLLALSGAGACP